MGAGLGFLRGGPLGAIVGGAVQYVMTKRVRKLIRRGLPGVVDESAFVTCIVVVMTKIAMVKGHMTPREVEAIYRFFVTFHVKAATPKCGVLTRITDAG